MLAQERYDKILEILERDNSVKVSMLTKLFNVSIETVRRDMEYLEKEGLLQRVYGGAVLAKTDSKQLTFNIRQKEHIEEKREIADIAVRFVAEGQSIAMDGGTTTLEVARALKKNFQRLTIITNSLAVVNELSDMDKYTIIMPGGVFKAEEFSFVGSITENTIGEFRVDTAFIGVSGISVKEGITDFLMDEIKIQKKMIDIAQQVILLAHSSKFDSVSLLKLCDFSDINMIITDSKLKQSVLEKYLKQGVSVLNQ